MRKIILIVAMLAAMAVQAKAQFVVASCGTLPNQWVAGDQNRPFVFDVNGNLCNGVTVSIGNTNMTEWGGVAVGAMANYGTSPGAVKVPGANAFVTNTVSVQLAGQTYTNIPTSTNTVVKASAGTFVGLNVNTGGTTSTAVVYDNTTCTGTKIGTFDTTSRTALVMNAAAATGICVTTAGSPAADVTVTWR